MAYEVFPEELGDFRLHAPVPGSSRTGWTLSWCHEWLPGCYADRDACLVVMGMVLAYSGSPRVLEDLRERYNRAVPTVDITVAHVMARIACDHPNGFGRSGCSGCGATR